METNRQPHLKKGNIMDWIERLFGISPDGGDGTTEMLYVVATIAVAALVFGRLLHARRFRGPRD
jgi:hypothetical protein